MQRIVPCRTVISERFPIASFDVEVPSERCFEIACASDPALFRPEGRARRSPQNFYSSRFDGLLRAPAGRATFLMPADQLRHFAGQERMYYLLGSYRGGDLQEPIFSVPDGVVEEAPYVAISPDFTGRTLVSGRLPGVRDTRVGYGSRALEDLIWGGDAVLSNPTANEPSAPVEPIAPSEPTAPSERRVAADPLVPSPPAPGPPPQPPRPQAPRPPPPRTLPLTVEAKFRILVPVAREVAGAELYSAVRLNPGGGGLAWGWLAFEQRSGLLGRVLDACHRRDPAQFVASFGGGLAADLLRVTRAASPEARLQPVGERTLWEDRGGDEQSWPERFRHAGRFSAFRAAQNEVGIQHYLDGNLRLASWLDFTTDRALAMLVLCGVELGRGDALRWVADTLSPVRSRADRDRALAALGYSSLAELQSTVIGLEPDGRWSPQTAAALLHALTRLGERSPLPQSDRDTRLRALVAAAQAEQRTWAERLQRLHDNRTELHDSVFELA